MDCMTDGNRVRTTGAYDSRILRVLNKLEGMKKWGANRSFSFENTPYNLEAWFSVFPQAVVTGVTRPRAGLVAVAGGEVAPRPARPALIQNAATRPPERRAGKARWQAGLRAFHGRWHGEKLDRDRDDGRALVLRRKRPRSSRREERRSSAMDRGADTRSHERRGAVARMGVEKGQASATAL